MKLGYLRVSTTEQKPDRQIDGLKDLCDELFIEKVSALGKKRPVYDAVIAKLQEDDTLIVWDLDRAFRSTVDAVLEAEKLRRRGIHFQIVTLKVDTRTPAGMLVYTVMAAFGQYEQQVLAARTREGLAAARRRGRRLGRPPKLSEPQLSDVRDKLGSGKYTLSQLARHYGVAPWTLTRSLKRLKEIDCDRTGSERR